MATKFGEEAEHLGQGTIEHALHGIYATCIEGGVASKITALIEIIGGQFKMKCALYRKSDSILVATTVEITVPVQAHTWVDFAFASPPTLTAQDYYLLAMSENQVGPPRAYVGVGGSGTGPRVYQESLVYPVFPSPATLSDIGSPNTASIYLTYAPSPPASGSSKSWVM